MKIKDYLKNKNLLECEWGHCRKNIQGFDFMDLEEAEVFEAIKKDLESKDLWLSYGPVKLELAATVVDISLLPNGKLYPIIWFVSFANYDGMSSKVSVCLTPFDCSKIVGDATYDEKAQKRVSKAISKFMSEKFGVAYVQSRKGYFEKVKDLKIKAAQMEADMKVKEAEKEFEENVFDI